MFWLVLQFFGGLCLGLMFWLGLKQGCSAFALLLAGLIGYYIYLFPKY